MILSTRTKRKGFGRNGNYSILSKWKLFGKYGALACIIHFYNLMSARMTEKEMQLTNLLFTFKSKDDVNDRDSNRVHKHNPTLLSSKGNKGLT